MLDQRLCARMSGDPDDVSAMRFVRTQHDRNMREEEDQIEQIKLAIPY